MNEENSTNYSVTADDVEVSGELESGDNSTSDHTVVVDPDQLIGPQVIDMIMNKSEFSFLIRYYSLLYQSLIPNCKLTINTLRQHISISDNIEQYIVGAASHRTSCQRLINFILIRLYSEKDYMQFCYHLNIISVMTDLPYRLIAEFRTNGNWGYNVPVHPGLSLHKLQANNYHVNMCNLHSTSSMDVNIEAVSALSNAHQLNNCLVDNSTVECFINDGASDDRAVKCCISNHYYHNGRRRSVVVEATATNNQSLWDPHKHKFSTTVTSDVITMNLSFILYASEWRILGEHFNSLCNILPNNYKQSINKLRHIPHLLKNRGEQLSKLITLSSTDVRKINEKIITYLIVKLCYNGSSSTSLVRLCDVMDELIDPTNIPTCVQQIRSGLPLAVVPCSSSTVMDDCLPQSQQSILSQPSSLVSIVSDTHTITSPVTTLSVVECLTTSSSVVTSISGQQVSTITTTAGTVSPHSTAENHELPVNLLTSKDFTELRAHYHNILHLMPDDYELTVGKLQNYISFDQICVILSSSDSTSANKTILDNLIERMSCREDILDLCDQMENIAISNNMKMVIDQLRLGVQHNIQFPVSTAVTTNTRSLLSSDQQHDAMSPVFQYLQPRYLKIIKSLPELVETTIDKLDGMFSDECIVAAVSAPNPEAANKIILDYLMKDLSTLEDLLDLCNQLEKITESPNLITIVDEMKTELATRLLNPQTHKVIATSIQSGVSLSRFQQTLMYEDRRLQKGYKYQQPPPLLSSYVNRETLLNEIATKLLQATIDPNNYGVTLTVTGAGGFGKTTIITSLCHHPSITKQFSDGFVFITLGPQCSDPSIKLRAIYNLLANEKCDINVVEQKVNQLTSEYYQNLLVIIDDVWHVEDAEPFVRAFSNCKTIITTRMNDIERYMPSKQQVMVGSMTQHEAITLLLDGVVDSRQLSQSDVNLLHELSEDVHLWPLLLSLIRGQLLHYFKQYRLSYNEAIRNVQTKLNDKGLTAFDKSNTDNVNKSRNLAVKACIEVTLNLLIKSIQDRIKSLILWNGIGSSLQIVVLNSLWNVSRQDAEDTIDVLWAYGVIKFTTITVPPNNDIQNCVEVHAVISQYIISNMDTKEMRNLSPFRKLNTAQSVNDGLILAFQQSYGVRDTLSLTAANFLKYKLIEKENVVLPYYIQGINMITVTDPHDVSLGLQCIKDSLKSSPNTINVLPLFDEEIDSLMVECKQILKVAYKLCNKFNQRVQRNLCERNYDQLIKIVDEFIKQYPICKVAQKAITLINKVMLYCERKVQEVMVMIHELMQIMTTNYHTITTFILPFIKFIFKLHKQITSSLMSGSHDTELTYSYIRSGKFDEERKLIWTNYLIKLQEVAPNFVHHYTT